MLAVAIAAAGCGSSVEEGTATAGPPSPPQVVPRLLVTKRAAVTRALPAPPWAVSFDALVGAGSALEARLGTGATSVGLMRLTHSVRWRHVEATPDRVAIDGRSFKINGRRGSTLTFGGHGELRALIISSASDHGSLLLHRVAEIHGRIGPGQFPAGADLGNHLRIASRSWTSGFWPGALWQAAALIGPHDATFLPWALRSTLAHLGREHTNTHDVGLMYGQSSLAGWRALCTAGAHNATLCRRLKRSVVKAADELRALAGSNRRAGTIPTSTRRRTADTIVDSMMNIAILPWASRFSGNAAYARLASHHAHLVASLLVRPDGSTAQSVHFDRATGRVLFIHTHQGLSSRSTWSRGQAWAVYGFAQAATDLRDRSLLTVALRAAAYVERHLPPGAIPRWDYDARPGAPVDVSAGVITAAGLFHLAQACRSFAGVCANPGQWDTLARRLLAASLALASDHPPLGYLGSQILNERKPRRWGNGGELIFGLTYALEALRLAGGL